ncbi:MAG: YkgJ family cysteine cluster protein [Dehalococcoidia bacterium]|nr:YkgJ family cysteine cluster protein [Dehalococcoidia bacterium]
MRKNKFHHPDCMNTNCGDVCCRYGADVLPEEYERIISLKIASPGEFSRPYMSDGEMLYRTRVRKGGCVFLMPQRGCRLHATGHKPITCRNFPIDMDEAREAYEDGYLPCFDTGNSHQP